MARRVPRSLARLLVLALAACVLSGVAMERRAAERQVDQTVYLPDAKHLKPLTLGYHNVMADVLWFRTITYFSRHYRTDRDYPWLRHMCEIVTDLDPKAEYVYRFAGMILAWEAKDPSGAIEMLDKGMTHLPDSWLLPYWAGLLAYLFHQDYDSAASYLTEAARKPGADPSAANLAALMLQQRHGTETTLAFLEQLERGTKEPAVVRALRESRKRTVLAAHLDQLERAVQRYRERHGDSPRSLSDLVDAGLIDSIPPDPFGGEYRLDPATGKVASSTGKKPARLHQKKKRSGGRT